MTTAWKELSRGKTIGRSLLNVELSRILPDLNGKILDLGGGGGSYSRFLSQDIEFIRTDVSGDGLDAVVDFNEPLPYTKVFFDAVLLLNALYIAKDPKAVLAEISRILRPGGRLILSTPYLMAEMREPHDYVRFTSEWLQETLATLGYSDVRLIPIGERFTAAANLIDGFGTRLGRMITYLLAEWADTLLPKKIRSLHPSPIAYVTTATISPAHDTTK